MSGEPSVRVTILAHVGRVVRALARLERKLAPIPPNRRRRRPFFCRLRLHHWSAWDIVEHDFRVIEKSCRRCGERRRMVYKVAAFGSSEVQPDAPWPRP